MRVSADYSRLHDPEERNKRSTPSSNSNHPSVSSKQVDFSRLHDPEERNKKSSQDKVELSSKAKEISKNQPPIQVAKNSSPGYTYTDKAKNSVGEVIEFAKGAGDATLTDSTLGAIQNKYNSNHPTAYKIGQVAGHLFSTIEGAVETGLSIAAEGGGIAVSSTGIGAFVGAPVSATAVVTASHGAAMAKTGGSNTVKSAEELYNFIKNKDSSPKTSSVQKSNSIQSDRQAAVRQAWKDEKNLVQETGQGTRPWTRTEKKELLENGKVKGYEGHHINSVNAHPEQVKNPDNIKFVKGRQEHLKVHDGNFRNPTSGKLNNRRK